MSRIGKKPIILPNGVTVTLKGNDIAVKGPLGTLHRRLSPNVEVNVDQSEIRVTPAGKGRRLRAFWGLSRALLANMVVGVSEGFKKEMSLIGVGYRVALEGKTLVFNLGYSHQIKFPLPAGIDAKIGDRGVAFSVHGIDKELVGQTCATIRSFRPPEPYKGKGIRYANEYIRQKAGKAGAK
ncbi:MAG: 50S ribosomal protein L6 [Myxococcota bacterium]|nr:50S ribosomal protein L6 [Myxococcota bacterium]